MPLADQEPSDPQSWNLYTYVRNNPVTTIDADGRGALSLLGKMAKAAMKGEAIASTFSAVNEQLKVAFDSKQSLANRIEAGGKALSEVVLPVSMQDGEDLGNLAGNVMSKIDEAGGANMLVAGLVAGGTYTLRDRTSGDIERSGRTNDLDRRRGEHARAEETKDLKFRVEQRTDDPKARRGLEQILHDKHRPPMNKRNPIAPDNPKKDGYMKAAWEFFKKMKKKGK